ncbi:MAG TPA: nitrate- and nitrite sensing domain-containing protein [Streptomyces sp.]|nr:nitrate- and nitrite sensing domain-containing protein [Streptomyces sp.]
MTPTTARRARVRNRLLVSVVLCAVSVLAAGAPGVAASSRDLTDSQRMVDRAGLGQRAVSLSHALADERDELVRHIAAGRPTGEGDEGEGISETGRARVDRGIRELRADAPAGVRRLLDAFPDTRRRMLTGKGDAVEAYEAYTEIIQSLGGITAATARALPGRAENATADALPDLGRAAEQASATRGLLLAALAAGGEQPQLTAAAQQAHLREQAALADFEQTATASARDAYARTVTGADVTVAERYLARLTDQPRLDSGDQAVSQGRVESALSARVDRMRSMESSLATAEVRRLEKLRDDDVTAVELRVALLGGCLLLTLGISVQTARSMARPLAVVRRGSQRVAADPVREEPITYKGRNDEFADVVRAVNQLRETAVALHGRTTRDGAATGGTGPADLAAAREQLAAERERLLDGHQAPAGRAGTGAPDGAFVHLVLRSLELVERQAAVIGGMGRTESDQDRLTTVSTLDHLAARLRRHNENLLLLAGAERTTGTAEPVPLPEVLRAAVGEVEGHERVEVAPLSPHGLVAGPAAAAVSRLVAELLDGVLILSPPDAGVRLLGRKLENGGILLSVQGGGVTLAADRLAELNARLDRYGATGTLSHPAGEDTGPAGTAGTPQDPDTARDSALDVGLYMVARLAARHGMRIRLRAQKGGGVAATVVLPQALLSDSTAPAAAASATATGPDGGGGSDATAADPAHDAMVRAAGPYFIEPDEHARTEDEAPAPAGSAAPAAESTAEPAPAPGPAAIPGQRKPGSTTAGTTPVRSRRDSARAEELRRQLGGFQPDAREGHQEAAARTAADGSGHDHDGGRRTDGQRDGRAGTPDTGGPVEEARK